MFLGFLTTGNRDRMRPDGDLPAPVSRGAILRRGLAHACPNCGAHTLYPRALRWVAMNEACRKCGLRFERGEGFFLGAMVVSYSFTGLMLVPILVLVIAGVINVGPAVALMAAWCVLFPLAFYRTSKSLWMMAYYLALPSDLPANGGGVEPR